MILDRIAQFSPGFRDCVVVRTILCLERWRPSLLSTFVMIGHSRRAALQQARTDHDYGDVNALVDEETDLTGASHKLTSEVHDHLFTTTATRIE